MYPIEIENLFNDLKQINYAVFKEIDILKEGLNGKEDVDIYIDYKDKELFENILKKYKFIKRLTKDKEIVFFYGYIKSIDRIVLLHIHYKLLIGSKRFKEIELKLPYDIEYIENIKIYTKELMLIIAMIRSIYRKELKEDKKLLEFYIKNSNKKKFKKYIKDLNIDLKFPNNISEILNQKINLNPFINYNRYLIGVYIRLYSLFHRIFRLPNVQFEKGMILEESPENIKIFQRLEFQKNKIYKFFNAIVIGNKKIDNSIFWDKIVGELK